jgi:hypothetical protein
MGVRPVHELRRGYSPSGEYDRWYTVTTSLFLGTLVRFAMILPFNRQKDVNYARKLTHFSHFETHNGICDKVGADFGVVDSNPGNGVSLKLRGVSILGVPPSV